MRECEIDGCEKPLRGRGMCGAHYMRWQRYGDPQAPYRTPKCGTVGGHSKHRRDGTTPCDPCREAFNAHRRAYRAEQRKYREQNKDYRAGTCTECKRPMVKRRTPKELIPAGHIRAYNKDVCTGCIKRTRENNPDTNAEYLARQQERAKAMDPALAAMMRRREERLAREARRKRAAQILANQGRRPAA